MERDNKCIVRVDLPGIQPRDINLSITDDAILIEGERKDEQERETGAMHVTERRYGRFYRAIPLPEGVMKDAVEARFDNGVLEIEVPMEQRKSERRQIQIQSGPQPKAA
jgi:HSP20 family protein